MRVVLDTNVVVSGLLWSGTPREILNIAERGGFQLIASEALIEELRDVLYRTKFSNRFEKLGQHPEHLISHYLNHLEIVDPEEITVPLLRDPDDLMVLACALSGQADYIVSGDPDLLALNLFENIPIVNPIQFVHIASLL